VSSLLTSGAKANATITLEEHGYHEIQVLLCGKHISGSPFGVVVHPKAAVPAMHWFYKIGREFIPFSKHESNILEALYQKYLLQNSKVLELSMGLPSEKWTIDFTNMRRTLRKWELFTVFNDEQPLIRGTWFWTDDNEKLLPYTAFHAASLETGFIEKNDTDKIWVNENERKKRRYVIKTEEGAFGYRQFRIKDDARPDGRIVKRGYDGKYLELNPEPLIWDLKRILVRGFKTEGCIFNQLPMLVFLNILSYSHQSELDQYALIVRDRPV